MPGAASGDSCTEAEDELYDVVGDERNGRGHKFSDTLLVLKADALLLWMHVYAFVCLCIENVVMNPGRKCVDEVIRLARLAGGTA